MGHIAQNTVIDSAFLNHITGKWYPEWYYISSKHFNHQIMVLIQLPVYHCMLLSYTVKIVYGIKMGARQMEMNAKLTMDFRDVIIVNNTEINLLC